MLYRFKSKAGGDVVMLQPNGKQLLEILGKDPAGPGIILPEQMPGALQTLRDAVFEEEAELQREIQEALARDDDTPDPDRITLRVRVTPFIELLQYSMRENTPVTWGV
ncbi:DUF1840 domain-containing protein [Malikia sp.]|uniref:DUF1840 domain-containing protein n=1 Tax=Malikia sp. TaxID=2070706 RepID=UPI002616CF19|nr:DUF1840 domain-containing protein [Malikia sp.]MDD2729566.1 DUF1840 domain-containing protein [Malikia sp.]